MPGRRLHVRPLRHGKRLQLLLTPPAPDRPAFRYDSYCGLYCGACDILQAYRHGLETQRTPEWSDLPERFRKHLPAQNADIRCHGCKSDTVFRGCARCPMRSCARKRGNVELCVDCADYPCLRTRLLGLVVRLMSLERKLPHQRVRRANQERIRCVGLAEWLVEQDRRWRCPQCGTLFSWYRATCPQCGRELDSLKGFG